MQEARRVARSKPGEAMNGIEHHFKESLAALGEVKTDQMRTLMLMADRIAGAFRTGSKLLLCGNGGSAADAQHIAAEFVVRYKQDRRAFPALALTTDSSVLTAGANDFGYASVFARQVEALGRSGDILWAISTSGTSANVLGAIKQARDLDMTVLGFTGQDGYLIHKGCDLCFASGSTTALAQQLHIVAAHAICDQVEQHIRREDR